MRRSSGRVLFLIINPSTTASLAGWTRILYPENQKHISQGRISDEQALNCCNV